MPRRHQYGQVYEHHGPQRIQHPVAGVDPRGEYDVLVADRPAQAVYRADHGERAQEDQAQAPESAARRQPEQGSDKRHRKTYPEHEGHRVAGVPERFLHELELGPAHHGHGEAAVGGDGPHTQVCRNIEMLVGFGSAPLAPGAGNLQAAYHQAVIFGEGLGEIPVGAQAHEAQRVRDRCERRLERIVGTGEQRSVDAVLEIVVVYREFVAPGLQGVAAVAVDHHVVRQTVQFEPAGMVLLHRPGHERLELHHSVFDRGRHSPGHNLRVVRQAEGAEGDNHQHHAGECQHQRGYIFYFALRFHS